MKVIPFFIVFREVNLRSSFEYSILKEILKLLGPPVVSVFADCKSYRNKEAGADRRNNRVQNHYVNIWSLNVYKLRLPVNRLKKIDACASPSAQSALQATPAPIFQILLHTLIFIRRDWQSNIAA